MPILEFEGKKPRVHPTCYIASNAMVIGDVTLGEKSSVWPGAVIRGDHNRITIGAGTNVQDNCVIHVTTENPAVVGDNVTIGHGAIVHACSVGNHVLIGMGAIILEKVKIEDWVIIAAGAVVTEDTHVPSKTLVAGVPAKVIKNLDAQHLARIKRGFEVYVDLSRKYLKMETKCGKEDI
ncbi:MAG: gamma carbonic anhydrase family protein [Candidatus Bathyarchaeia archaeon]